jgi:hypothetical protein
VNEKDGLIGIRASVMTCKRWNIGEVDSQVVILRMLLMVRAMILLFGAVSFF